MHRLGDGYASPGLEHLRRNANLRLEIAVRPHLERVTGILRAVAGAMRALRCHPRAALTASVALMLLSASASPAGARIPHAVSAHQARACPNANRRSTQSSIPEMRAA